MARVDRKEGVGLITAPPLTSSAIDKLHAQTTRRFSRDVMKNAAAYANVRVQRGLAPEPRFLVSELGFTDHPNSYNWSYMPPSNGAYRIYAKGQDRPWSYIMLHCFGAGYDNHYLLKQRNLLEIAADKYGHHPVRWRAGLRELVTYKDYTRPKSRKVSIHFCISRRGDILASCDLNDAAYHGGGDVRVKPGGNNKWTVGIELEAQTHRTRVGKYPTFKDYPARQMIALAILCKKLETIRPVAHSYLSKQLGSMTAQAKASPTGYFTHKDIKKSKTDPGAQFNILPGSKGSGWDQLWGYMARVRSFNLATEVFRDKVDTLEMEHMTALAQAMQQANSGQQAALRSLWDKTSALRRASNMQAQTRRTRFKNALGQTTTLNNTIAGITTSVAKLAQKFDIGALSTMGGYVPTYNETTGLWETADG